MSAALSTFLAHESHKKARLFFDYMKLKDMKPRANQLEPSIQVGKLGITDTILTEIKVQLQRKKVVKIRYLSVAKEKSMKVMARELAVQVPSVLVQQVGNTVTLGKIESK